MAQSEVSFALHSAITELVKNQPYGSWSIQNYPESEEYFLANFEIQVDVEPIPDSKVVRAIFSNDPADFGFTYSDLLAEIAKIEAAEPMRLVREIRDDLLLETDWMANSDSPDMTAAWKTYRQELRDMPATSSPTADDFGGFTGVVWPTKPE